MLKVSETKISLRKSLRTTLKSFSAELRLKKSESIAEHLRGLLLELFKGSNISVGGFAPTKTEVSWFFDCSGLSLTFLYPYPLESNRMEFRFSDYESLVESHSFGPKILVPAQNCEAATPDVVIIPGIGFTNNGHRLGQGGGYYDKYLQNYNGKKIGICFSEQILPDLPFEEHDVRMDYLISESGVEYCLSA